MDVKQEVCEAVRRTEDHINFSRSIVLLVILHVKKCVQLRRWSDVLEALYHDFPVPNYLLQMVDDYLRNRELLY